MKVYLSADIEGVAGVSHWDQTLLEKSSSQAAREQMTAEVAAACEGALEAGAREIWIQDAHDTGRNLLPRRLPEAIRLVSGWSGHPFQMLQALDGSFDAVLAVGYHAPAGAGGSPLEHTLSLGIASMTCNGRLASEFLVAGLTAAYVGVPLVFVSGDRAVCDEVEALNSNIVTVPVKEAVGDSILGIHPALVEREIRSGVQRALLGDLGRCTLDLPPFFTVDVRFRSASKAFRSGFYPGARQIDVATVRYEAEDFLDVLRFFLFAL
ncbi:MAG: M55 family metallopeptidase [Candidatus Bipolaricaulota bacterium]